MRYFLFVSFIIILIFYIKPVYAQSNYVLPYPSFMPGSRLYMVHNIWEEVMKYWYFGEFGQFKYNLKQSDKYLVEAKTLLEYNQYLLAYNSLRKSDSYFLLISPQLDNAKKSGKDISDKKLELKLAANKHIDVLKGVGRQIPEQFIWQPEKTSPFVLDLKNIIEESIRIRQKAL